MNDRILEAYLKDFVNEYGLLDVSESEAFESFVNYCLVSRFFSGQFEPDDLRVGGSGDLGLDGIAIIVNDNLVHSTADVDYFRTRLRRLDVQFHLIQSKTSPRFDAATIGTIFSGVRSFFESRLPEDANSDLRELHGIKEHIYDASVDMDSAPRCYVHYATTGKWTEQTALSTRIEQGKRDLTGTGLFSSVQFIATDSDRLKVLHRELRRKISRELMFDKHTIVPPIDGVKEAYIGIVPCLEYLKLLVTEDGELDRRLFYDNVRDFQGHNAVNQEIEATIASSDRSDRFALLNNGVTIVAADLNKIGATFRLSDYQIVNGCQTSHVLYLNRMAMTDKVYLPIKVIVTTDIDVMNDIIQGTNRQTEVKLEAFESLTPFQKRLEEFYLAMGRDVSDPLYYERRSKQYEHTDARRDQVMSLPTQVKCFLAMFLNEPHSTHRYYGELIQAYRSRVFAEAHSTYPYYVAGVAYAHIERYVKSGDLPRSWRSYRYHLLMAMRLDLARGDAIPPLNSKKIDVYCERLHDALNDETQCIDAMKRAGNLVDTTLESFKGLREAPSRTRAFTEALVSTVGNDSPAVATVSLNSGTVKNFSDIKGFGFITGDDGIDYFVHYTGIVGSGHRSLVAGRRVRFVSTPDTRGPRATDVEEEDE